MGSPKRGDPQGDRVPIVLERSGQCPIHGEGEQGYENVRDCAVDAANREGISSQGRLNLRPGEPDAVKAACPVREEAVGKGPSGDTTCKETGRSTEYNGTSLAAYFMGLFGC
jgi:hypothetical protein